MLQEQTIEKLSGFGDLNKDGECYYCENFVAGQFGLEANIKITAESISANTRFNWMTEYSSTPYGVDTTGKLFSRSSGSWTTARNPGSSSGNGLITDQKGRLLYARNQQLGMYDGTWTDSWKDMVSSSTELRPMDLYEDWVVIGNVSNVALLNTTDDSFDYASLTLPSGSLVKAIKTNQSGVLIGVNLGARSFILLWDAFSDRSISEWIWFDAKIQSICKFGSRWIVTTQKEQLITDGYSTTPLPSLPDVTEQTEVFRTVPQGTMVLGNKLLTANTDIGLSFNRLRCGLYFQDLVTGIFNFIPVANGCMQDMTMGALFHDSSLNNYVSYSTNTPSGDFIGRIENTSPAQAVIISPRLGPGPRNKVAQGLKIDFTPVLKTSTLASSGSLTASLKIYNFKRQLWGTGVTNAASSNTTTLKVDGTQAARNNAKIGDEVTILSGAFAGAIRHVTAISGHNTSSEVWTLDAALAGNAESGIYVQVQPFRLVKTKSISISSLSNLESIYFNIQNRLKGRHFLAKLVISGISNLPIAVTSWDFIYDELSL